MAEAVPHEDDAPHRSRLAGRAAELAWLRSRLSAAAGRRPQLIGVTGEAGIGTSTLVAAALESAVDAGWSALGPLRWPQREPESSDLVRRVLQDSAARPVVIALDDPATTDEVVAGALAEFRHAPARAGLLVLIAGRNLSVPVDHEFTLGPLPAEAIAELAAQHGGELDPETARALAARAGGNPDYAIRLLTAPGGPTGPVPDSLARIIDDRLAALSPPARNRLGELALLEGLAGSAAASVTDELARAGLLDGPQRLRHGVVAERLLSGRADVLAAAGALAAATARGRLAGHDPVGARRIAELGIDHLDRSRVAADGVRAELLLLRGIADNRLGERAAAAAAFAGAADLSRRAGRTDLLVEVALARPRLADQMHLDLELRALLDEALPLVTDDATQARLLARRATELPFSESEQRRRLCDEALARAAGADPAALAEVLHHRITALNDPGLAADRLATAHRLTEVAARSGDPELRFEAALALFAAALEAGRIDEVDACAAVIRRQADESGAAHHRAHALLREAALAFVRGRFDEAGRSSVDAMRIASAAGLADAERMAGSLLTSLCHLRGDPAGAEMMRARAARDPLPGFVLALFLHQAGAEEEARFELQRGHAQRHLDRAALWLGSLAAGAELADRIDDPATAVAVLEPLRTAGGTFAVTGGGVLCLGANEQFVGHALSALGRHDEAIDCFEQAITASRRIGSAPFAVRSTVGLVRALTRRSAAGDAERVERLAGEVAAEARLLGMAAVPAMLAEIRTMAARRPAARPAEARQSTPVRFTRAGEVWTLRVAGRVTHLKSSKGLVQLAALLAAPGREIASAQLAGAEAPAESGARTDLLDEEARHAYRRRLAELDEQRRLATARGDAAAEERAEREQDALVTELRRVTGLGGRPRSFTDEDERARVNVTRTLRAAVERIFAAEPEFGLHLAQSIRTGARCAYVPAPDAGSWSIEVERR